MKTEMLCNSLAGARWPSVTLVLAKCLRRTQMPTLTIRNIPESVIRSLKSLAARNARSMEQEVREILEENVIDRISTLEQIEKSWKRQARRPTPGEINRWIRSGRE